MEEKVVRHIVEFRSARSAKSSLLFVLALFAGCTAFVVGILLLCVFVLWCIWGNFESSTLANCKCFTLSQKFLKCKFNIIHILPHLAKYCVKCVFEVTLLLKFNINTTFHIERCKFTKKLWQMEKFLSSLKTIGILCFTALLFLLAFSAVFGLVRSLLPSLLMPIALA